LALPEGEETAPPEGEKSKVDLPQRSKSSPLLRRVIGGGLKDKGRGDDERKEQGQRAGPGRVGREIAPGGRSGGAPGEKGAGQGPASRESTGKERRLAGPPAPLAGAPAVEERGNEPGVLDVAEVFTKTAPDTAENPQAGRRRRHKPKMDQEAEWQGGGRSSLWWLGGGLLCVLLVTISVFVMLRRGGAVDSEPARQPGRALEADPETKPYESLPIAEFVARSAELLPVVRDVLMRAESIDGQDDEDKLAAELLRGGVDSFRRRQKWRERYPAPAPFREDGLHEIHASGTANFAYVIMTGEREDFERLTAYFVKEDGRMLLDWEATEGYSEVLIDEVEVLKDGSPRMMRGVISLSNFYTDVYPENEFRCYTLHHDDPTKWLWAYAELNGEVDFRLLTHMQTRDPLGRAQRVAVKITKQREGSRANQVEISEMLFGGWIEEPAVMEEESVDQEE